MTPNMRFVSSLGRFTRRYKKNLVACSILGQATKIIAGSTERSKANAEVYAVRSPDLLRPIASNHNAPGALSIAEF